MSAEPWLRRYGGRPDARRLLLCFPHAGGAASAYRGWAAHLPPDVELWAAQYPGRENRIAEPLVDTMDALVDALVAAVEPALDRPVLIFGHSMGGSVAHEVAIRLAALRPGLVRRLVISARPAPAAWTPRADPVHRRDDDGVVAEVRALGGSADALADPQLRALLLPMIRNDFRLIETYRPNPAVLDVELVVLAGTDDVSLPVADTAGWSAATTGRFARHVLAGDHFYLHDHLPEVIARVTAPAETRSPHPMTDDPFTVDRLRGTIAEVLELPVADVTPDASLFELGLDSMKMMMLSVRWQAHGVEIPFGDLAEHPTVEAWSALLGKAAADR
ncbi:hypothetical protein GCM10010123_38030 [Pilimelia anulata]|uniref:Carrier domain-containing protein n=1 Tax=Pilimelia anulata TaxID=53371 RepID=A0A8J3FC51_9ACTN|nr:alpha/beta fold hydrolase [Pilimelia anulata]GGK04482.1 hypothetical protein GCM10010123_38030 [Pilimelia anulata]